MKFDKATKETYIFEKGLEQGKKENQKEVAKKLLKLGIDRETIEKATGLSKEEIKKL